MSSSDSPSEQTENFFVPDADEQHSGYILHIIQEGKRMKDDVDRIWPDRPDRTTYQLSGIKCPSCGKEMQLVIHKITRKRTCTCGYSEDISD
jgi:hypothetical protein